MDRNRLPPIVDECYKASLVPSNIENRPIFNSVSMGKYFAQLCNRTEISSAYQSIPMVECRSGIRMLLVQNPSIVCTDLYALIPCIPPLTILPQPAPLKLHQRFVAFFNAHPNFYAFESFLIPMPSYPRIHLKNPFRLSYWFLQNFIDDSVRLLVCLLNLCLAIIDIQRNLIELFFKIIYHPMNFRGGRAAEALVVLNR